MSAFQICVGWSNVFGVPIAVGLLDPHENDGFAAFSLIVGPFFLSFEWRRS